MTAHDKSAILELMEAKRRADESAKRRPSLGPSSLSTECDACVARAIRARLAWEAGEPVTQLPPSPYWMGAEWGTAIHDHLHNLGDHYDAPIAVEREKRLQVGTIAGFPVTGFIDRLDVTDGVIRDYKGVVRKDLTPLKATYANNVVAYDGEPKSHVKYRHKVRNYLQQALMYGPALENMGHKIEYVTLEFFARDGSGDGDIFVMPFDYDREYADALWERANIIASDPEAEYATHPECFPCNVLY